MFSRILDRYRQIYKGMYCQTEPETFADHAASREALTILSAFAQGQERAQDAKDALICLVFVRGDAKTS